MVLWTSHTYTQRTQQGLFFFSLRYIYPLYALSEHLEIIVIEHCVERNTTVLSKDMFELGGFPFILLGIQKEKVNIIKRGEIRFFLFYH